MKATGYEVFKYQLPLTEPLTLKDTQIQTREGLLICFSDAAGNRGWGDCAPLPAFSAESLADAQEQIMTTLATRRAWQVGIIDTDDLLPSVEFALETAMLNLHAESQQGTLAQVLSEQAIDGIDLNGLVDGAAEGEDRGFAAMKMKVARGSVADDVARVLTAREQLGPDIPLFVDANRGWSEEDARQFYAEVSAADLLYIEEPTPEPWTLEGLPVALDESLLQHVPEEIAAWSNVVGYVLKPTVIGGFSTCWAWADQAQVLGLNVTVSAAFESGVGLWNLANMAAALPAGRSFAGLDTGSRLAEDVLSPRFPLEHSRVRVDTPFSQQFTINTTNLDRIAHG